MTLRLRARSARPTLRVNDMGEPVRLQKFLAAAGVASRRKAEELILAGRVKVNAATVTGARHQGRARRATSSPWTASSSTQRRDPGVLPALQAVRVRDDARPIPEGRPTALRVPAARPRARLPGRPARLGRGGRGPLHRRRRAREPARPPALRPPPRLPREGAGRPGARGAPAHDAPASGSRTARRRRSRSTVHEHAEKNVWIRVVVGEGRFHLVKRLCEAVGLQVQRLFRPEFGGVTVDGLRAGQFRPLAPAEVRAMRQLVGLEGGEAEPMKAMPRSALPKAARRHGHGPPRPPGADRPAEGAAREDRGVARDRAPREERAPREDRRHGTAARRARTCGAGRPRAAKGRAPREGHAAREDRSRRDDRSQRGDRAPARPGSGPRPPKRPQRPGRGGSTDRHGDRGGRGGTRGSGRGGGRPRR